MPDVWERLTENGLLITDLHTHTEGNGDMFVKPCLLRVSGGMVMVIYIHLGHLAAAFIESNLQSFFKTPATAVSTMQAHREQLG